MLRSRTLLAIFVTLNFTLCCDGPEGIHLDGWEPICYVDGVPVYTKMTEDEICLTSGVNGVYQELYGVAPSEEVYGFFVIRTIDDPVPCMDGPFGTACAWGEIAPVFGFPDTGATPGPGGLTYMQHWVFISSIEAHAGFYAFYTMHEYGHAVLKMHHTTGEERTAWCEWQDPLWLDWVEPVVDSRCPGAWGRYGYVCPWV